MIQLNETIEKFKNQWDVPSIDGRQEGPKFISPTLVNMFEVDDEVFRMQRCAAT